MGNKYTEEIIGLQDEQATMNWENVSIEQLKNEISELYEKIDDAATCLTNKSEYKSTEEKIKAIYSKELTKSGKLFSFVVINKDSFPSSLSDIKSFPKFFADLSPEQQKKYKELFEYWACLKSLEPVCTEICELLINLPLLSGYKLTFIKMNLDAEGFSSSLYQQINSDVLSLMEQVNQDSVKLENRACDASDKYSYKAFKGELKSEDLKDYKKARCEDYIKDIQTRCSFYRSSLSFSNNRFHLKTDIVPRMLIIDKYSAKLAEIKKNDFESKINKSTEKCNKINEHLKISKQSCNNKDCLNLIVSLSCFISSVEFFISDSDELYKNFKEAKIDSTPYCFMRILPAFKDGAKTVYGLPLNSHLRDPWESGTDFARLYMQAELAVNMHFNKFMEKKDYIFQK